MCKMTVHLPVLATRIQRRDSPKWPACSSAAMYNTLYINILFTLAKYVWGTFFFFFCVCVSRELSFNQTRGERCKNYCFLPLDDDARRRE